MEIIKVNLQAIIEDLERSVSRPDVYVALGERNYALLSDYYRRLGIACYLGDFDVDFYFRCLKCSGESRKKLLILSKDRKPGRFQSASHVMPFFDAFIGNYLELAADIAKLSPKHWIEEEEYEEDFHYASFLHAFLLDHQDGPKLQTILEVFKTACQDIITTRFLLCEALYKKDKQGFLANLMQFVDDWDEDYRKRKESYPVRDEEFDTERFICVEGMALLKFGVEAGIAQPIESPYMPLSAWKTSIQRIA